MTYDEYTNSINNIQKNFESIDNDIEIKRRMINMKTPSRHSIIGEWKFVGEGAVLDHHTGKEHKAKLQFRTTSPSIETNPDNREDVKTNLKLIRDENNTMWEMLILDNE